MFIKRIFSDLKYLFDRHNGPSGRRTARGQVVVNSSAPIENDRWRYNLMSILLPTR